MSKSRRLLLLLKMAADQNDIDLFKKSLLLGVFSDEEVKAFLENNSSVLTKGLMGLLYAQDWAAISPTLVKSIEGDPGTPICIVSTNPINIEKPLPLMVREFKPVFNVALKGVGKVPTLYIYSIRYLEKSLHGDLLQSSKLFATYSFFIDSIKGWIDQTKLEKFISEKKSVLDYLLGQCAKPPVFLGQGTEGSVFDIGGQRVLKILANNTYAYQKALESIDRLHTSHRLGKTEAMIYDAGIVGEFDRNTYYYILMEKMQPVSNFPNERRKLRSVMTKISDVIDTEPVFKKLRDVVKGDTPYSEKTIDKFIKRFIPQMVAKIDKLYSEYYLKELGENLNLSDKWLERIIEELIVKYITGRTDLHLGNLGITKSRELRYFDPTYKPSDEISI